MSRVRIVTDSTADLPKEIIRELGIIVVPLKVAVGEKVYRDGVDISSSEIVNRLEHEGVMPITSQPSPGEFVAVYEQLTANGDSVVSVHLSGKLSGTVQSAQTAKAMTDSKNIFIVDAKTASMGLGLMVMAAARAARKGKSAREILALIKDLVEKSFVLFLVDTLDYLEKGGRIGKASAFLGTLLKIKPILTVDAEGQVIPLEKVRGKSNAMERIAQIIGEKTDRTKLYQCAFIYGNDLPGINKLKEQVLPVLNCHQEITAELGPVILSHTGPGLIGVAVQPE